MWTQAAADSRSFCVKDARTILSAKHDDLTNCFWKTEYSVLNAVTDHDDLWWQDSICRQKEEEEKASSNLI